MAARHFRRLLAVRMVTQSGDGVLQIALASFVLFSPERQPDATSAGHRARVTLLLLSIWDRSLGSSSTAGHGARFSC